MCVSLQRCVCPPRDVPVPAVPPGMSMSLQGRPCPTRDVHVFPGTSMFLQVRSCPCWTSLRDVSVPQGRPCPCRDIHVPAGTSMFLHGHPCSTGTGTSLNVSRQAHFLLLQVEYAPP